MCGLTGFISIKDINENFALETLGKIKPKAIHFTEGGPWLNDEYKSNKYADLWLKMEREFKS